jgi:hypothetical protein
LTRPPTTVEFVRTAIVPVSCARSVAKSSAIERLGRPPSQPASVWPATFAASLGLAAGARWDRLAMPRTTPSLQRSSRSSNASYSTNTTGPTETNWPEQSSNGSKPGTNPDDATATTTGSAPSTTKPPTRHDQHRTPTPSVKPGHSTVFTTGWFGTRSDALDRLMQ